MSFKEKIWNCYRLICKKIKINLKNKIRTSIQENPKLKNKGGIRY